MRCKCPVDSLLCRADKNFLHSYGSLMRCKCPLVNLLCRVDKHFLHLYGLYDSATITQGLLPTRQATKLLSHLKRCKSPLDSLLCRVDKQVPLMRCKCPLVRCKSPLNSLLCPLVSCRQYWTTLNNSQVSEEVVTVKPGQDSIHELII